MLRFAIVLPVLVVVIFSSAWADTRADKELINNGGFEQGERGWGAFWSRSGDGLSQIVAQDVHRGKKGAYLRYDGQLDWSYAQSESLDVTPGDIYELSCWIRVRGAGSATLGVILYDAEGESISWDYGGRTVSEVRQWRKLQTKFVIPPKGTRIVPRLMGSGPVEVWLDEVSLRKSGTLEELKTRDLPESLQLRNALLTVTFRPSDGSFSISDHRTGQVFDQRPQAMLIMLSAREEDGEIVFRMLKPDDLLTIEGTLRLDGERPELVVELEAKGAMRKPLQFPAPFGTQAGQFLIMPVNEGISYPVDDRSLEPMHYHLFGGHGLSMAFWGVTDLQRGLMAIVETPDDARVATPRIDGTLCLAPEWLPQKQAFGPTRRIRYVLFDTGGYVAICKRYREYARRIGQFKTLEDKRAQNPNVDKLVGAVNVWCWDRPADEMCEQLQSAGIRRILWSCRSTPERIRRVNKMGVLSSRYDIYQDVMDPRNYPELNSVHSDWPRDAWPEDIVVQADGSRATGWEVRGKNGHWYACAVLCDLRAVEYARRRIESELKTHPYACRFIDTTTAASWRECYHPDHPMTRTISRNARMKLLALVSDTCGLVTGSETGHDAAVPYVHYFEGMLSLGPYRIPDAGRKMIEVVEDVPGRVAKFQTGHYYRLPLWELVYHDCVVAQWYWGDYNNKLPSLWDRRDLFNALYGTPPMFMFNRRIWRENRDRFVESYNRATPVARSTGYSEMTGHRWLTNDHAVQQTQFANGVEVTVNFGAKTFAMPDGRLLLPLSHMVHFPKTTRTRTYQE